MIGVYSHSANFVKIIYCCPFYLFLLKNFSKAATIEGVSGAGAFMWSVKPASSTALEVLLPKAPILVPFCLYRGKFSNRLLTPLGVKKQITSNSDFVSTCFTSLLMVRYINGVSNSHLLA